MTIDNLGQFCLYNGSCHNWVLLWIQNKAAQDGLSFCMCQCHTRGLTMFKGAGDQNDCWRWNQCSTCICGELDVEPCYNSHFLDIVTFYFVINSQTFLSFCSYSQKQSLRSVFRNYAGNSLWCWSLQQCKLLSQFPVDLTDIFACCPELLALDLDSVSVRPL